MKSAAGAPARRAYRMRARQQAVDRTRERICEAVYRLWLRHPYDEVTLDAVARDAGVTRQTVLRHFGSKEDLFLAATDWFAPREDASRDAEPGDVDAALRRLVERFEEMGDANVRLLELEGRVDAVDYMLGRGRASHRAWIERVFGPLLPLGRRERDEAVLALYAATDVTVWKLLRRDFGQSRADTQATIARLVDGVLRTLPAPRTGRAT